MPDTVRCDVCGGLYSSRHLSSHKRLSHGSKTAGPIAENPKNDQDAMRRIVDLFGGLSEENKKNVLYRLTVPPRTS
jgi:hypothetical protein